MNPEGLARACASAVPQERVPGPAAPAAAPRGESAPTDAAAGAMGVDGALAWVKVQPPDKLFQALDEALATAAARMLAAEVERLRAVGETCADLLTDRCATLAAIRAALPEIIGCDLGGSGRSCIEIGARCCSTRQALVSLGLLPPAERPVPEDHGA